VCVNSGDTLHTGGRALAGGAGVRTGGCFGPGLPARRSLKGGVEEHKISGVTVPSASAEGVSFRLLSGMPAAAARTKMAPVTAEHDG
jgi:hypothetical protein